MNIQEEYQKAFSELELKHEAEKNALIKEYCKKMEIFSVGDIIKNNIYTIKIQRITASKSFGEISPVYRGISLKKDLTPKKNNEAGTIYGNKHVELIKKKEER